MRLFLLVVTICNNSFKYMSWYTYSYCAHNTRRIVGLCYSVENVWPPANTLSSFMESLNLNLFYMYCNIWISVHKALAVMILLFANGLKQLLAELGGWCHKLKITHKMLTQTCHCTSSCYKLQHDYWNNIVNLTIHPWLHYKSACSAIGHLASDDGLTREK